jgi:hypothetical protein
MVERTVELLWKMCYATFSLPSETLGLFYEVEEKILIDKHLPFCHTGKEEV